jgi:phosphatidylglycerophosphate synthase
MSTHDTPNAVTLARLVVGAATAVVVTVGGQFALIVALVLHLVIYTLDTLDGQLAQAAGAARGVYAARVGGFLDGAVDGIVFSVIALVLTRKGLITEWSAQTVVASRMLLMAVRGAAALGSGEPLGPTRLTKISGGAMGLGSLAVVAEAALHPASVGGSPTFIGMLTSAVVSFVVIISVTHYLLTAARKTVQATVSGVDGPAA